MACLWLLAIGVLSLSLESQCNDFDNKYYNYTLLRIFPTTAEQLQAIHGFEDPDERVEVLKRSYGLNDSLDVLVPPEKLNYVQNFSQDMVAEEKHNYGRSLHSGGLRTGVESNLTEQASGSPEAPGNMTRRSLRLIPPERKERRSHSERSPLKYMSYDDMMAFVDETAARHRDVVQIERLGKSYEGREMRLVKISSDPGAQNPIIFIDAGIHSREWVAPNMALYLIDRLTSDHNAKYYDLNGLDWYILPVTNPDGYEFSRSSPSNRMWRKTRSRSTNECYGVDGNRNFGFKWAVSGVSRNPCHKETYAGAQPFSEPETRIVRDVMMRYKDRMKLYTSLHSYGNYLVYPWGYTGNLLPKSWRKLDRMAHLASDAVVRAGGKPFKVLSAGKWYAAAGGSDDYAFGAAGVPYSYTMELTEGHEFNYPEHLLPSTLPQFYPGFRAMGEQIRLEYENGTLKNNDYDEDNMNSSGTDSYEVTITFITKRRTPSTTQALVVANAKSSSTDSEDTSTTTQEMPETESEETTATESDSSAELQKGSDTDKLKVMEPENQHLKLPICPLAMS